ncbi:uncharacterized protein LOC120401869 [Mauremys reevesii]|uniref:uncharacterized protein LOC120401869 n=1 Tax=Mauremys reevesii TaxID=260615 RepID=UPI00193F8BF9|nr:uncharacterized protein LOC120401869 [Mauremys reevesii]
MSLCCSLLAHAVEIHAVGIPLREQTEPAHCPCNTMELLQASPRKRRPRKTKKKVKAFGCCEEELEEASASPERCCPVPLEKLRLAQRLRLVERRLQDVARHLDEVLIPPSVSASGMRQFCYSSMESTTSPLWSPSSFSLREASVTWSGPLCNTRETMTVASWEGSTHPIQAQPLPRPPAHSRRDQREQNIGLDQMSAHDSDFNIRQKHLQSQLGAPQTPIPGEPLLGEQDTKQQWEFNTDRPEWGPAKVPKPLRSDTRPQHAQEIQEPGVCPWGPLPQKAHRIMASPDAILARFVPTAGVKLQDHVAQKCSEIQMKAFPKVVRESHRDAPPERDCPAWVSVCQQCRNAHPGKMKGKKTQKETSAELHGLRDIMDAHGFDGTVNSKLSRDQPPIKICKKKRYISDSSHEGSLTQPLMDTPEPETQTLVRHPNEHEGLSLFAPLEVEGEHSSVESSEDKVNGKDIAQLEDAFLEDPQALDSVPSSSEDEPGSPCFCSMPIQIVEEDSEDDSYEEFMRLGMELTEPRPRREHKKVMRSIVCVAVYAVLNHCLREKLSEDCEGRVIDVPAQRRHDCVTWTSVDINCKLWGLCAELYLESLLNTVLAIGYAMQCLCLTQEHLA